MNRHDPRQLRVVGATDLERRLLDAGARELPSVELTKKMREALGISIAAGAATAATSGAAKAATVAATGSAAPAFAWPAISVGVLALAVTGAVVGARSTANHHAARPAVQPAVLVAAPAPVSSPALAPPPAAAVESRAEAPIAAPPARPVTVERRPAVHHHAAVAATPRDLRAEIALLDAARTAVAAGADDRALALLNRYETSYPRATFRPEAAALRIEALAYLGRTAQARALAQRFVAAHPDSPLADRVARVTELATR